MNFGNKLSPEQLPFQQLALKSWWVIQKRFLNTTMRFSLKCMGLCLTSLAEQCRDVNAELSMHCGDWKSFIVVCDFIRRTELGCEGRVMNAMRGLKEFVVCEFICWTELGCEGRAMNAVLGLKEFVCMTSLAEQCWALKAELGTQCWDWKSLSLCVT